MGAVVADGGSGVAIGVLITTGIGAGLIAFALAPPTLGVLGAALVVDAAEARAEVVGALALFAATAVGFTTGRTAAGLPAGSVFGVALGAG